LYRIPEKTSWINGISVTGWMTFLPHNRESQNTENQITGPNHKKPSYGLIVSSSTTEFLRKESLLPLRQLSDIKTSQDQYLSHGVAQQFGHHPAQVCRGQNSEQCRHMGEQFVYHSTPR